jgi:hypothetical protein
MTRPFTPRTILSLLVGLLLGGLASAAPPNGNKQSPYAPQIQELHAVKVLLETANHDYKGHRAAAVKALHTAIHALAEGHHEHHKHHLAKAKGNNEPQALSDAQLQNAAKKLAAVEGLLVGNNDPRTAKAVAAIQGAIKHLEKALEIR